MKIVAEQIFDLAPSGEKVIARLFEPQEKIPGDLWTCRFEVGEPISAWADIHGSTSLQALVLSLKCLSAALYGSEEYRAGKLGVLGEFGGGLMIPATHIVSDIAHYPF